MTNLPDLLENDLLAQIKALQITAKKAAHSATIGLHHSKHHGSSTEFKEHRIYLPGDDLKHLDWRIFAKNGRYYVKKYQDEINNQITFWLDISGSMAFEDNQGQSKLSLASKFVAALAYIALHQNDAVSLLALDGSSLSCIAPSSKGEHLLTLLKKLVELCQDGKKKFNASCPQQQQASTISQGFSEALNYSLPQRKRHQTLVIISDLWDDPKELLQKLKTVKAYYQHTVLVHCLSDKEQQFDYESPSWFSSLEDTKRMFILPKMLRQNFIDALCSLKKQLQQQLLQMGIPYLLLDERQPVEHVLRQFLQKKI